MLRDTRIEGIALEPQESNATPTFEELFDVAEMQQLQDALAAATGVGSLITRPDGSPITRPSNFCKLCDMVRCTDEGLANCLKSDAIIGAHDTQGPIVQQCLSAGLWDAGASITVGGNHVANWLVGQVRIEGADDHTYLEYARKIGADPQAYAAALAEVQQMSLTRFEQIAATVFSFTRQLSAVAHDATQRRLAQEAIEERERWLAESQRIARIGHYIYHIDVDRWDGSDTLFRVMGVDSSHRRDFAQWISIIHPDDQDRMAAYFAEHVVAGHNSFDTEYRIIRPADGMERWVHGLGDVQYDDDGRAVAMFGTIQDVTERKLLEGAVQDMLTSVVDVVGHLSETRDPYTAGHQRRVAELAVAIAHEMALPEPEVADIQMAALMHDVGKISVPAEILSKPSKLSAIEFDLIKRHAESGFQIVSSARMRATIAEYVHQHHERCDGSGYPRGLRGDEILRGSRVLMVADVVEAMMSHRPYRPGLGVDAALAEVESGSGSVFDSQVCEACARVFRGDFEFSQ